MQDTPNSIQEDKYIFLGHSGRISTVLALGWLATLFGRSAVAPLLPTITDNLAIDASKAGFSLTLMMACYALFQYPSGRYSDTLSRKLIIVLGIGIMILGFTILMNVWNYPMLLISLVIVGIGGGMFFSPARGLISELFIQKRGRVLGLHMSAGMVGGMLAAGSAIAVLEIASWRAAFLSPTVLLIFVLILFHRWSRGTYKFQLVNLEVRNTLFRLLKDQKLRSLLLVYSLFEFVVQGFMGFLPALLQIEKGFSPTLASVGFALIFAVGVVIGPLSGYLSDNSSQVLIVVCSLVSGGVGIIIILVTSSKIFIIFGIIIASVGLWSYVPPTESYLMDILPKSSIAGDFGLLKTIYTALGSLGPTYIGLVAVQTSYTVAFAGLVVSIFTSAAITFYLIK